MSGGKFGRAAEEKLGPKLQPISVEFLDQMGGRIPTFKPDHTELSPCCHAPKNAMPPSQGPGVTSFIKGSLPKIKGWAFLNLAAKDYRQQNQTSPGPGLSF
jgi:hypothetical protein